MTRTIADLERACLVLLDKEQRRANPDNALIATLCESVRMGREYCNYVLRRTPDEEETAARKEDLAVQAEEMLEAERSIRRVPPGRSSP
jgi:hypothetical protein